MQQDNEAIIKLYTEAIKNNPENVKYIPKNIMTKNFSVMAINLKGSVIKYIDVEYLDTEICYKVLEQNIKYFCYIPEDLKDKDLCMYAIKKDPSNIKYVYEITIFKELSKIAVKLKGSVIQYIDSEYIDVNMCYDALNNDVNCFCHIAEKFKDNDLCIRAITGNPENIKYVPDRMMTKELSEVVINLKGSMIQYIGTEYLNMELCYKALKNDINCFYHIPKKFKDRDLCMYAINLGHGLAFIENPTYDMFVQAIKNNPYNISDVPEKNRNEELCLLAVQMDGQVLYHISADKQTEYICIEAVKSSIYATKYVKIMNYELAKKLVKINGLAVQFIDLKYCDNVIYDIAINDNIQALKFVPKITFNMLECAFKKDNNALKYCDNEEMKKKFVDTMKDRIYNKMESYAKKNAQYCSDILSMKKRTDKFDRRKIVRHITKKSTKLVYIEEDLHNYVMKNNINCDIIYSTGYKESGTYILQISKNKYDIVKIYYKFKKKRVKFLEMYEIIDIEEDMTY